MARKFATTPSKLTPITLSSDVLASIGKLVRAWAEIEDLVTLYINRVIGLNDAQSILLMGHHGISRKLQIAAFLAKATGPQSAAIFTTIFGDQFYNIQRCRNAIAHGVLLGKTDYGTIAFMTTKTEEPENGEGLIAVASYNEETIANLARIAEEAIPRIEKSLKLSALREKRWKQALVVLPQGRSQQKHKPAP